MGTQFHSVELGCGGTYKFDENGNYQERIKCIGASTIACNVGVYLPISNGRCFFAVIRAFLNDDSTKAFGSGLRREGMTEGEGEKIRAKVKLTLEQEATSRLWSSSDIATAVALGKKPVIATRNLPGWVNPHVVHGIQDFVGPSIVLSEHTRAVQGFAVQHETGEVDVIPYHIMDFAREARLPEFQRVAGTLHEPEDWKIVVPNWTEIPPS